MSNLDQRSSCPQTTLEDLEDLEVLQLEFLQR